MRILGKSGSGVIAAVGIAAAAATLLVACTSEDRADVVPVTGEHKFLKWHEDGGVDLITFGDKEVIHLTSE